MRKNGDRPLVEEIEEALGVTISLQSEKSGDKDEDVGGDNERERKGAGHSPLRLPHPLRNEISLNDEVPRERADLSTPRRIEEGIDAIDHAIVLDSTNTASSNTTITDAIKDGTDDSTTTNDSDGDLPPPHPPFDHIRIHSQTAEKARVCSKCDGCGYVESSIEEKLGNMNGKAGGGGRSGISGSDQGRKGNSEHGF